VKTLKIVDLTTLMPGPFSTFLLQKELGAEVVKIEDINQGDPLINMRPSQNGVGLAYTALNSQKRLLKVNFRDGGIEKIKEEIKDADIFIHNFKPTRAFKLGLGSKDLFVVNQQLLYCFVSGYGNAHPFATKAAHDLNILALSGYLDQQLKGGEVVVLPPLLLADIFTAYQTALRVMANLILDKKGVELNISMFDSFLLAMTTNNIPQLTTGQDFAWRDFPMSGTLPCYSIYNSKDNCKVCVAALEKPLWVDFCEHIKRPDLVEKQYDSTIHHEIATEIAKYDKNYWLNDQFDFCVTPVLSINEAKQNNLVN